MAGFETIVRPVIFPNIRPAPARARTLEDDPDEGKAVIAGGGGGTVTNSYNYSISAKLASAKEHKRQFDEVRVRPSSDGGNGNGGLLRASSRAASDGDVYIDLEVVNKLWLKQGDRDKFIRRYAPVQEAGNVEVLRRNVTRKTSL